MTCDFVPVQEVAGVVAIFAILGALIAFAIWRNT